MFLVKPLTRIVTCAGAGCLHFPAISRFSYTNINKILHTRECEGSYKYFQTHFLWGKFGEQAFSNSNIKCKLKLHFSKQTRVKVCHLKPQSCVNPDFKHVLFSFCSGKCLALREHVRTDVEVWNGTLKKVHFHHEFSRGDKHTIFIPKLVFHENKQSTCGKVKF